jgi:poly(A) polymerase
VNTAFIKVIAAFLYFVKMDIVFARLALSEVPENMDVGNEELLKNLDLRCIRSLNGKFIEL